MIKIVNECVGCDYPCIGKRACPLTHVHRYYCDKCGEEVDTLYWSDNGEQLCLDCIEEMTGLDSDEVEEQFEEVYEDDDDGCDDWSED